jgi:predicted Fe-S protein YdhL (DUF1289 family)
MNRLKKDRPKLITPCVHICKLSDDVCIGCKRTTEEISNWFWYEDVKKLEIMEQLKDR